MDVLPLVEYIPLFSTKADAKRYRKAVLEYVADLERDRLEFEAEKARILANFPKREPTCLGDDFIARWAYVSSGGTAIRRKHRRELKQQRKRQVA